MPHDRRSITHQIKDGNPLIKRKERGGKNGSATLLPLLSPVNYSSLLTLEPQKLPFIPNKMPFSLSRHSLANFPGEKRAKFSVSKRRLGAPVLSSFLFVFFFLLVLGEICSVRVKTPNTVV